MVPAGLTVRVLVVSGSADVLEALGINVELEPDEASGRGGRAAELSTRCVCAEPCCGVRVVMQVASCIEETGVGFMFAPVVHPAMRVRQTGPPPGRQACYQRASGAQDHRDHLRV